MSTPKKTIPITPERMHQIESIFNLIINEFVDAEKAIIISIETNEKEIILMASTSNYFTDWTVEQLLEEKR